MSAISSLALGTVQFGLTYGISGPGQVMDADEARAILRLAADSGIDRLDTAPAYGAIEERLAALIEGLPFGVVTKISALPRTAGPDRRRFVRESIERSRKRLGTKLVGVLFHDSSVLKEPDREDIWNEAERACGEHGLKIGLSGYDAREAADLVQHFPVQMAQLPGNALDQRLLAVRRDLDDVEITLRSIFLQGLLLMDEAVSAEKLPATAGAITAWSEWCRDNGVTKLEGAISLARGFGCEYCVVGVDHREQMKAILSAWETAPRVVPELAVEDLPTIDPRLWPRGQ